MGGYGYYGKRSADAEPEAAADAEADPALLYGAYGYGLPYSSVYRSYGAYPYGYRTYGAYPYAYYGKRSADAEPEADAEADPALLYGAYVYGLPYAGVYGGYRTYGAYGAYPYSYGYYGKRSADAEPEADPALHPLQRCVSPDHCLHPRCRSPDHCLHWRPPGRLHPLSRRPSCQGCRPPGRPLPRPRRVHCPQGPSPRCRCYLCWTRPLFPRWSLPQQCRCPGPLLNSTTSTSPN